MFRLAAALLALVTLMTAVQAAPPESARSRAAMARITPELRRAVEAAGFAWGAPVFLRIFKSEAVLEVWLRDGARYRLFRAYPICAFSGGLGPKLKQGDRQAPEGFYRVTAGRLNPYSRYHLSFDLGYPNTYDRAHGRTGNYLMVHGDCVSIGCYAMAKRRLPIGRDRNAPIEEIWTLMVAAFANGQRAVNVHAFPFRLTTANLARHRESPWHGFWTNLKRGHDLFERNGRPSKVSVRNRRYVFSETE